MKQIRGLTGVDRGRYFTRTAGSVVEDSCMFRSRRQQGESKPLGSSAEKRPFALIGTGRRRCPIPQRTLIYRTLENDSESRIIFGCLLAFDR